MKTDPAQTRLPTMSGTSHVTATIDQNLSSVIEDNQLTLSFTGWISSWEGEFSLAMREGIAVIADYGIISEPVSVGQLIFKTHTLMYSFQCTGTLRCCRPSLNICHFNNNSDPFFTHEVQFFLRYNTPYSKLKISICIV